MIAMWADETKPVPRPVFGEVSCDRCRCTVQLGALDGGVHIYAAARERGFVMHADRHTCRSCSGGAEQLMLIPGLRFDAEPAPCARRALSARPGHEE